MGRTAAAKSSTFIGLLRGINVGGNNKLPMKELSAIFSAAGCEDVRTYIQSGNVVCTASSALARDLPLIIAREILAHAGLRIPVIMRSAQELRAAAERNPFLGKAADLNLLHLGFLADLPKAAHVAALDAKRSPPDEFQVLRREIYFRFPGGLGKSKLTSAYFDSKLGTTLTVRNWRTVLALLELSAG